MALRILHQKLSILMYKRKKITQSSADKNLNLINQVREQEM